MMEHLTRANKARELMAEIDELGGMAKAIESAYPSCGLKKRQQKNKLALTVAKMSLSASISSNRPAGRGRCS